MSFLFLLSFAGLGAAHQLVSDTADDIQVVETWYQGDPTAAADLQLKFTWEEAQQLSWDIDFSPMQEARAQFQFYPYPVSQIPDIPPSFKLHSIQDWTGSISFASLHGLPTTDETPLAPLYQAVSEHTQAGSTHSEVLTLRDYYDTYPLDIQFYTDHMLYSRDTLNSLRVSAENAPDISQEAWAEQLEVLNFLNTFQDAFRFPVPADHQLNVTVSKDHDGNIIQLDTIEPETSQTSNSPSSNEDPGVLTENILIPAHVDFISFTESTDTAVYFILEARRADGALLDYRLTPGGYGVYRMPMQEDLPKADQLESVCPLRPEQRIENFQLDDRGARLLLTTRTDTQLTLHILDAATGLPLQTFSTKIPAEGRETTPIFHQDNLIALFPNRQLQLYAQDKTGEYSHIFYGELPTNLEFPGRDNYAMAYDGERFVLVFHRDFQIDPICALMLLIWDQEQMLYAGTFRTSLNQSLPARISFRPLITHAPSICFTNSRDVSLFTEGESS